MEGNQQMTQSAAWQTPEKIWEKGVIIKDVGTEGYGPVRTKADKGEGV